MSTFNPRSSPEPGSCTHSSPQLSSPTPPSSNGCSGDSGTSLSAHRAGTPDRGARDGIPIYAKSQAVADESLSKHVVYIMPFGIMVYSHFSASLRLRIPLTVHRISHPGPFFILPSETPKLRSKLRSTQTRHRHAACRLSRLNASTTQRRSPPTIPRIFGRLGRHPLSKLPSIRSLSHLKPRSVNRQPLKSPHN